MPSKSGLILPGDKDFVPPEQVNRFHTYDDVDSRPDAHHHTLGTGANQAAAGTHGHVGEMLWLRDTSGQSIPGGAWTKLTWNTTEKNTGGSFWEINSPNPGDVLIRKKGLYLIRAHVPFVNAAAMCYMRICVNETAYQGRVNEGAQTDGTEMQATYVDYFTAVGYVSVQAYNGSGGAQPLRNTFSATEWLAPNFQIVYLGS